MMNCDSVHELLWAYCEGMLDDEAAEQVDQHIRACGRCRREHRAAAATLQALKGFAQIEPDPDLLHKVWQRIDQREAAGAELGLGYVWSWLRANRKVVAAGSMAFLVALFGVRYGLDYSRSTAVGVSDEQRVAEEEAGYMNDYILVDVPETVPVSGDYRAEGQDTIETRFITREVVPTMPYADEYIQPVVESVSDDDSPF